jgi:hypothetical protein
MSRIGDKTSRRNPKVKIVHSNNIPDDRVGMTPELKAKGFRIFKTLIKDSSPLEATQIVGSLYTSLIVNFFKGDVDKELERFCSDVKFNLATVEQDEKPEVVS